MVRGALAAPALRRARGSFRFHRPVPVVATGTVAGRLEAEGPLGDSFDLTVADPLWGERTWERAEVKFLVKAAEIALDKAGLAPDDIDVLVAGDLLDQTTTSNFAARALGVPFLGVYNACATSAEALLVAAALVDGGLVERALVATASHHLAAERQYRYPVELGVQRKPYQQWTATGGAAFVLDGAADGGAPVLTAATVGRVRDMGLKDPNNMGAAMAPAAADTLVRHLAAGGERPEDYDVILTGDLGVVGSRLLPELLAEAGVVLSGRHQDAGLLLYDRTRQDVHAGGSGTVCSALVLGGVMWRRLATGEMARLLFLPTGSLHSVTSFQQGESIPCTAHAVVLEGGSAL
jgi:stage V sporulation protein AD